MIDCLSTRSPFGPIGTGKGGPAFEATAWHFGFSMPRYSAEQLARAAEAGQPKANSEFADDSEWQAYQTEWLGIFLPAEQVPSARDPQRRVVWQAATRQFKKMAAQNQAESEFATGQIVGATSQLDLNDSSPSSQAPGQAGAEPGDPAPADGLVSSNLQPQSEYYLTPSGSAVGEEHTPSPALGGAVEGGGMISQDEPMELQAEGHHEGTGIALDHAVAGLGSQWQPFMENNFTPSGSAVGEEHTPSPALGGAVGPNFGVIALCSEDERRYSEDDANESVLEYLPPAVEPFVATMEALLNTQPELLSEINKQLCVAVYYKEGDEHERAFVLAPTQQRYSLCNPFGQSSPLRVYRTKEAPVKAVSQCFGSLSRQELQSYLDTGVVPAAVAALETEHAAECKSRRQEYQNVKVAKIKAMAEAAAATKAAALASTDALLAKLCAALDDDELGSDEKRMLEAAIDSEAAIDNEAAIDQEFFVLYQCWPEDLSEDALHEPYSPPRLGFATMLDGDGDNLLVRASRRGRVKTVEYLIDLSRERMKFDSISYVNKCNGFGDSPLMAAAINGHVNVVRKLLDSGADAYACNPELPEGFTVLVAAVQRCTYVTCDEVPETVQKQQLEVVRCLLEEYKVELRPAGLYGERGLIYETEHMT